MTRYIILKQVPIGWDCTDLVYRSRERAWEDMEILETLHPENVYKLVNIDCNELGLDNIRYIER